MYLKMKKANMSEHCFGAPLPRIKEHINTVLCLHIHKFILPGDAFYIMTVV